MWRFLTLMKLFSLWNIYFCRCWTLKQNDKTVVRDFTRELNAKISLSIRKLIACPIRNLTLTSKQLLNDIKLLFLLVTTQVWRSKQSFFCSCADAWCAGESLGHVGGLPGEYLCEGEAASPGGVCHHLLPACLSPPEWEQVQKILSKGKVWVVRKRFRAGMMLKFCAIRERVPEGKL